MGALWGREVKNGKNVVESMGARRQGQGGQLPPWKIERGGKYA